MKKLIIVFFLFALVVSIVLYITKKTMQKPEKPKTVPRTAIWDGGIDGGNWIDCKYADSLNNTFYCVVYEDYRGKILYEGIMKLEGEKVRLGELQKTLGIYSGDEIYLKNNKKLISVEKKKKTNYD